MTVRPRTFFIGLALLIVIGLVVFLLPFLSDPDRLKAIILQQAPQELAGQPILGVDFIDAQRGWLLSLANGGLTVFSTQDAGQSWQSRPRTAGLSPWRSARPARP